MKRVIFVTLFLFVVITASSVFAQTPSFKVAWKEGIVLGLLVPSNTTPEQLKDLVYKFRKAKQERTLATLIPPINRLSDPYMTFIILIFSDSKWATPEEYKKYERSGMETKTSRTYLNHIVASYSYDFQDGKEYGSLGYDDGVSKSVRYKKLF